MNCTYHPEVPSSAFCQYCGKPICKDCVRNVGGSIYCEACLTERLRGAGPGAGVPAPVFTGTPHPMLAALLGFIPGVGAMYNGQYAKAIAHVVIFAVLASLSDHVGPFGILVAAWVFYQVFDAYQTAMARRDGLPLPNPFGLNDIAQRLGIHPHPGMPRCAAGGGAGWGAGRRPPQGAPYQGAPYQGAPYQGQYPGTPQPGAPYPGASRLGAESRDLSPAAGSADSRFGRLHAVSGQTARHPGQQPGAAVFGPAGLHAGAALRADAALSSRVRGPRYSDGSDHSDRAGHPVPLRLARAAASRLGCARVAAAHHRAGPLDHLPPHAWASSGRSAA